MTMVQAGRWTGVMVGAGTALASSPLLRFDNIRPSDDPVAFASLHANFRNGPTMAPVARRPLGEGGRGTAVVRVPERAPIDEGVRRRRDVPAQCRHQRAWHWDCHLHLGMHLRGRSADQSRGVLQTPRPDLARRGYTRHARP